MSMTATPLALLVVAMQDLRDGEQAWMEMLPILHERLPEALPAYVEAERERSDAQRGRLDALLADLDTPEAMPNIWLRAILDDAKRDSETIADGPLRAIAMVGAFRKGKQSERVSYETAIGLAAALGRTEAADALTRSRDEEAAADAALAALLAELLQSIE